MRIAELPWYDLPELTAATDAWWRGIARHLRRIGVEAVPAELHREGTQHERWRNPQLLLSQACGYDLVYDEAEHLAPVATPVFAIEGCIGPRYRSIVVVRNDRAWRGIEDLRGLRVVVNEAASHSGTNAMRPLIAPHARDGRFFAQVEVTGSHTDSVSAVRDGQADVACIDAVVLGLMRRCRPESLRGLRPLACTEPALAPPYVTSAHTDVATRDALRAALRAAIDDPALDAARRSLGLNDVVVLPVSAYAELEAFEDEALRVGYHELPAPQRSPLHRGAAAPSLPRGSCA